MKTFKNLCSKGVLNHSFWLAIYKIITKTKRNYFSMKKRQFIIQNRPSKSKNSKLTPTISCLESMYGLLDRGLAAFWLTEIHLRGYFVFSLPVLPSSLWRLARSLRLIFASLDNFSNSLMQVSLSHVNLVMSPRWCFGRFKP